MKSHQTPTSDEAATKGRRAGLACPGSGSRRPRALGAAGTPGATLGSRASWPRARARPGWRAGLPSYRSERVTALDPATSRCCRRADGHSRHRRVLPGFIYLVMIGRDIEHRSGARTLPPRQHTPQCVPNAECPPARLCTVPEEAPVTRRYRPSPTGIPQVTQVIIPKRLCPSAHASVFIKIHG